MLTHLPKMLLCKIHFGAEQICVHGIDAFTETKLRIALKESMCNPVLRCCYGFTGVYSLYLFSSLLNLLIMYLFDGLKF